MPPGLPHASHAASPRHGIVKDRSLDENYFRYQNQEVARLRLATRKHRIGLARIITVIANAHTSSRMVTDRGEEAVFYQGYDDRDREIEVIVVETDDFDLVIHAMPVDYRRRTR